MSISVWRYHGEPFDTFKTTMPEKSESIQIRIRYTQMKRSISSQNKDQCGDKDLPPSDIRGREGARCKYQEGTEWGRQPAY